MASIFHGTVYYLNTDELLPRLHHGKPDGTCPAVKIEKSFIRLQGGQLGGFPVQLFCSIVIYLIKAVRRKCNRNTAKDIL